MKRLIGKVTFRESTVNQTEQALFLWPHDPHAASHSEYARMKIPVTGRYLYVCCRIECKYGVSSDESSLSLNSLHRLKSHAQPSRGRDAITTNNNGQSNVKTGCITPTYKSLIPMGEGCPHWGFPSGPRIRWPTVVICSLWATTLIKSESE